ncbi:MAG: RIP metalloprotease RseP [Opitutae bacterium]|nr:RIP metalloprotease RseP [Opitutae bacterium]
MEILTYAQALFLVIFFFGASIFVHELGHFLAALWRGLKVTRFSIGFGPRLWTWKREGIEYCISLLPIGGYVALPQLGHMEMIEGKAEEEIESKSISWTSKVIVLVAGAFYKVLFALLVASLLYLLGGRPVQATNDTTRIGFVPQSISIDGEILQNPAFSAGLRQGDIITAIDGEPVHRWEEVDLKVIMGSGKTRDDRPMSTFSLLRQGEAINVDVFPIIGGPERTRLVHLRPATPAIVGKLMKNSPAERAELMEGDEILTMAGSQIISVEQISQYVGKVDETPIEFTIRRDGKVITKIIQPVSIQINPQGEYAPMLGIRWMPGTTTLRENPFTQLKNVIHLTFTTLERLFHPGSDIGIRHLSGPLGIGTLIFQFALADFRYVLWIVVIINVNLAILNLLPIPVLDGGHIALASLERLLGKPMPQNLLLSLQSAFLILLLSLMVYVTIFDGLRIFRYQSGGAASSSFELSFPDPE